MEMYCNNNKLTTNTGKTKGMIINKTARLIRTRSRFENSVQDFVLTPSGEVKSGLKD